MAELANLRLLCATWVMLSGCGSDPEVSADTFALERARALCAQRVACCETDADTDSCTHAEADSYRQWMVRLRADFMPAAAASCLAAYRASCSELDAAVEQACARVWRGRRAINDDCNEDAECAPIQGLGTRCRSVPDSGSPGPHCVPDEHARENFVRVEEGQACRGQCNAGPDGRCTGQIGQAALTPACFEADGLLCIEGRCERLPGADAECVLGRCDSRVSYCDADDQCRPLEPAAASCRYASDCEAGLFCAADTGSCTPRLELGAACEDGSQCVSGACEDGSCIAVRPQLCSD